MKKKTWLSALFAVTCAISIFFFASCDKDTRCYVKISVIDEETKAPISGAIVKIDIESSAIAAEGTSDHNGEFYASFAAPAIFEVKVTYEDGYDEELYRPDFFYCYREGTNTIRLVEGDTVKSTVIVSSEVKRVQRT